MKSYTEENWKAFRQNQVDHLIQTASKREKDELLAKSLLRLVDLKFNKEADKAELEKDGYPLSDAEFYLTNAERSAHAPLNIKIATAIAEGKLSPAKAAKLMSIKKADDKRIACEKAGL